MTLRDRTHCETGEEREELRHGEHPQHRPRRPRRVRQDLSGRGPAVPLGSDDRLGKISEGNTVSDFDDEEIRRQISVSTSLFPVEWDGHKINVLDAPGYADFIGEMRAAMRVADLAVFVVSAVEGVEVQTRSRGTTPRNSGCLA